MQEKLWHKSYAPGINKALDYEILTIPEALTRSAQKFPNNTALNYMGKKITYPQLDKLVNRFARALLDLGIQPGDKVAVCLPNIPRLLSPTWPSCASAQSPFRTTPCTRKGSWSTSLTTPVPK